MCCQIRKTKRKKVIRVLSPARPQRTSRRTILPVEKPNTKHDPNVYAQPANQTTDPFFDKNCSTTPGGATFVSLTGEAVDKSKFAHNNCTPYFGARIKGAASSTGERASVLDNMAGTGSQQNTKREVAPLFKPTSGVSWPNGMPSTAEFMLSRQVPSTRMANIKPWAEEKEAPGLGKPGFQSQIGGGYNTAMQDRNAWLPKTVSELRTTNNPKVTYGLQGHEGAAQSKILQPGTLKTQGAVEKNRPDTAFALGPSRWFTTTGGQIGETHRSEEIMQEQDRGVCQTNYFGSGGKTLPHTLTAIGITVRTSNYARHLLARPQAQQLLWTMEIHTAPLVLTGRLMSIGLL